MWPDFKCCEWALNAHITENEGQGFRFFWPGDAEEMLFRSSLSCGRVREWYVSRGRGGMATVKRRVCGREVFWIDLI